MKKDNMVLRLLKEARPIWKWLILAAVLCLLLVTCSVLAPSVLGDLIDLLAQNISSPSGSLMKELSSGLVLLLCLYIGHSVLSYAKMQLLNRVVSRYFTCSLRIRISDKIKRLPVRYVDQTPVGDILSRMTDDVSTMGNYVHQIVDTLMTGFIYLLAIAVMMLLEEWLLALMVLALTPASLWLSSVVSSKSEKHFHEMFTEGGNLNAHVEESFTNFATTKAYHLEKYTEDKNDIINDRRREAEAKAVFTSSIVRPIITLSNALAYIAICLVGGWLLVSGKVSSVGSIVTILLYAKQFSSPLEQIAGGMGDLQHAKAAARRVFNILDMEEESDPEGAFPKAVEGNIRFEDVDFSYDKEKPLIEELCIDVKKGQTVAIVGPTGAGKTTIVNLLMRFYDIDKGKIFIDGEGIAKKEIFEAILALFPVCMMPGEGQEQEHERQENKKPA